MKGSIDYWWVVLIVIAVLLIFTWKPLMGLFGGVSDKLSNKEGYERGKEVFYDTELWGGKDSYKSCAMCHAPDFVPDPNKKIEMMNYREGEPYLLEDLARKHGGGIMDTGDDLYKQVMRCLMGPDRMQLGRVSMQSQFMQDLLVYLNQQ